MGWGECTPINELGMSVCAAPKGMVLSRFGVKTRLDFAPYDQQLGRFFKGSTRAYI